MEWLFVFVMVVILYTVIKKKNKEADFVEDDESSLAEFRITVSTSSRYSDEHKSKNKNPGKWIKPGQLEKIGNYEITGGFVYVGGRLKSIDGYNTEASLIDPTLKINGKSPDYDGEEMGYWPSYGNISPRSRAAYIDWLASDRCDPNCYIGYVFLYFYGIERRLLIDGKYADIPREEREALIGELNRLKSIYGNNRSFNGYVTSLLSHVWVLDHESEEVDGSLLVAKKNFTSVFKYLLAKRTLDGEPITAELALAWVKSHPEFSLRTPARRCENEFDQLFRIRYQQKFKAGLVISPNKTKLQLDYHPASPSLRGYQSIQLDLPDVSRLKTPVKKLMDIAESCTDELESYSRYVGKPENSRDSLAAVAFLPNELAQELDHQQFDQLREWIASKVDSLKGVVSVQSLLEHFGEQSPLKINKKEAEMLANLVEKAGFGMAPDIRFHHAKPELNGNLVLFPGGHGENFSASHTFNQVGTILRLGAMVAAIDGHVDEAEELVLENLIEHEHQLSNIEKLSLRAYLYWRLNTKVNMNGLKARLETISSRERAAVSHILVTVALADGKIDPSEIKQLEKLYTSLGLEKSMVSSDIHHLTSSKPTSPQTVGASPPKASVNEPATSEFSLNRDLLKVHEEETQGVKAVLESIFVDENVINEPEEIVQTSHVSESNIIGLDTKHLGLYEKLICKGEWSLDEVRAICEELNLMVDGAFEVINDWAFDTVDAPLIEDGSTVFIDLELVEEIRAL